MVTFTLFTFFLASLSFVSCAAVPAPERQLEDRDDVLICKAALVALKATSFCSSLINLQDVTKTSTSTGPTSVTTATVTAPPCTVTLDAATATTVTTKTLDPLTLTTTLTLDQQTTTTTTTLAAPTTAVTTTLAVVTSSATTTAVVTSTVTTTAWSYPPANKKRGIEKPTNPSPPRAGPSTVTTTITTTTTTKSTTTSTVFTTTTANICAAGGKFPQLRAFACSVVSKGCSSYVTASTSTITTTVPGSTITSQVTTQPACGTLTPAELTATKTATITPSPVITTETSTPPVSTVIATETPSAVTSTETITPPAVTNTKTETITSTTTSTVTVVPQPTCAAGEIATNNGFKDFYTKKCGMRAADEPLLEPRASSNQPDIDSCAVYCAFAYPNTYYVRYQRSKWWCACHVLRPTSYTADPDWDTATNDAFIN